MIFSPDVLVLGSTSVFMTDMCLLLTNMFIDCADNANNFAKF